MARILVLGADGMLGHIARIYLGESGHEILSIARSMSPEWDTLDAEDETALRRYISLKKPEYILNCIGVLVKASGESPIRAIKLNALLPHILTEAAKTIESRVIHISTDCVFSGSKGSLSECNLRDADDTYGRTKALGELLNDRDLTIRTSIVGPEIRANGTGLFDWFMRQAGTLRGFTRTIWGGVTTLELVKAVVYSIEHSITGLVQLTNGVPISKYELLVLFMEIWGKRDVEIKRDDSVESDRSLICSRDDFKYCVPSYRVMLEDLYNFMNSHSDLYKKYPQYVF